MRSGIGHNFAFALASTSAVLLFALFASVNARAAAPTLDALDPTGARPGQKTTVTIVGKSDPWPASAACG